MCNTLFCSLCRCVSQALEKIHPAGLRAMFLCDSCFPSVYELYSSFNLDDEFKSFWRMIREDCIYPNDIWNHYSEYKKTIKNNGLVGIESDPGPEIVPQIAAIISAINSLSKPKMNSLQKLAKNLKPSKKQIKNATSLITSASPQIAAPNSALAAAYTKKFTTQKPVMTYHKNGDVTIEFREYVADIAANTSNFKTNIYNINPGNPALFEWLAPIAARYESYNFEKLHFEYETELGTTASGSIMMGIDYDLVDLPPTTKQQLMSYQSSARSAPWQSFKHISKPQNLHKQKTYYVNSGLGPLPNTSSVTTSSVVGDNLSYVGRLFVCTQGVTVGIQGELYVDYRVKFMNPVSNINSLCAQAYCISFNTTQLFGPFSTSGIVTKPNNLGISYYPSGYIYLPLAGNYYIRYSGYGTGLTGPVTSFTSNGAVVTNNTFLFNASATEVSGSLQLFVPNSGTLVYDDSISCRLALSIPSSTTLTHCVVTITRYDPAIFLL